MEVHESQEKSQIANLTSHAQSAVAVNESPTHMTGLTTAATALFATGEAMCFDDYDSKSNANWADTTHRFRYANA